MNHNGPLHAFQARFIHQSQPLAFCDWHAPANFGLDSLYPLIYLTQLTCFLDDMNHADYSESVSSSLFCG